MAEIYLNPENAVNWASEGSEGDGQAAMTAEVNVEAQEAIKAASMLLQQMRPDDMQSNKYKVHFCPCEVELARSFVVWWTASTNIIVWQSVLFCTSSFGYRLLLAHYQAGGVAQHGTVHPMLSNSSGAYLTRHLHVNQPIDHSYHLWLLPNRCFQLTP